MLAKNRFLKLLISIEILIISSMIPIHIPIPDINNIIRFTEIPINWQFPLSIFITLIFTGELVLLAYICYIVIGLFFLPIFYDGGSLGYLLTPNFGYLIGIFPLIKIINILNKLRNYNFSEYIRYLIVAIAIFHFIGIFYLSFQLILFNKANLILYNIGKYSINKIPYQLLMTIPIFFIVKFLNRLESLDKWIKHLKIKLNV